MRRCAAILLWGVTASGIVSAQQICHGESFNSHADLISCEIKRTQLKSLEVERVFDDVMAANARFEKIPGTAPNLFTKTLRDDQKQWGVWVAEDCKLQGAVTMGTGGADIEQGCLQDAYSQRIKVLQQIIQALSP